MNTVNVPYVKKYDENGKVLPIDGGAYLHKLPNRKQRRSILNNKSFTGNHKGISLTVSGRFKYERVVQEVKDQFGRVIKRINHYLSK